MTFVISTGSIHGYWYCPIDKTLMSLVLNFVGVIKVARYCASRNKNIVNCYGMVKFLK